MTVKNNYVKIASDPLKSVGIFPLASAEFVNDVKVVKGIYLKCSNSYPLDLKVGEHFSLKQGFKKSS